MNKNVYVFDDITSLTPLWLREHGFSAVFADLDNTLAPHNAPVKPEKIVSWMNSLGNIPLVVVSNNHEKRVAAFCGEIPFICKAGKPSAAKLLLKARDMNLLPESIIFAGDQIRTDIRAAHRAGMGACLVSPLNTNAFYKLRRKIETFIWRI